MCSKIFGLFAALWLLSNCVIAQDEAPIIETSLGRLKGSKMETFEGQTIYAYRGIPYAKPPLGELRFVKPQPVEAWGNDVTLDATADSLICPQPADTDIMNEDCLKLNVFTKNITAQLPVVVFIHGGGHVEGSSHSVYEAGPQYLLDQDLVFVAFNYRLGALGFLSTGADSTYSGNYAFYDQLLALQWIQTHIAHFGGDPKSVTIMGLSAGGMAISLHLVSPLSNGLFHRAILMSGASTNHYNIDNVHWTRKLSWEVGCPMYEPNDVVACLRNVTWQRIVETCAKWEPYRFVNVKWNYEIDGYFLNAHPSELIQSGQFQQVPLLVSYTENELDYSANQHLESGVLLHDISQHFEKYAPQLFTIKRDKTKSQRIKDFYLGVNIADINEQNVEQFGEIFSDSIIGHGVYRFVNMARKHAKVYYSRMDYIGERSLSAPNTTQGKPMGVAHGDDLQYVMPGTWHNELMPKDHPDVFMMKRMTQLVAHFAKDGTPSEDFEQWLPCNTTTIQLLYNNETTRIGEPAYMERYALWDELYPVHVASGGARIQLGLLATLMLLCGILWKLL